MNRLFICLLILFHSSMALAWEGEINLNSGRKKKIRMNTVLISPHVWSTSKEEAEIYDYIGIDNKRQHWFHVKRKNGQILERHIDEDIFLEEYEIPSINVPKEAFCKTEIDLIKYDKQVCKMLKEKYHINFDNEIKQIRDFQLNTKSFIHKEQDGLYIQKVYKNNSKKVIFFDYPAPGRYEYVIETTTYKLRIEYFYFYEMEINIFYEEIK